MGFHQAISYLLERDARQCINPADNFVAVIDQRGMARPATPRGPNSLVSR